MFCNTVSADDNNAPSAPHRKSFKCHHLKQASTVFDTYVCEKPGRDRGEAASCRVRSLMSMTTWQTARRTLTNRRPRPGHFSHWPQLLIVTVIATKPWHCLVTYGAVVIALILSEFTRFI